jgi:hypothetical protein
MIVELGEAEVVDHVRVQDAHLSYHIRLDYEILHCMYDIRC